MHFRLTPRESSFHDLFARATGHLVAGAEQLTALLGTSDPIERRQIAERAMEIEVEAGELTQTIIRQASSVLVTPYDREDLLALAVGLDSCVDHMAAVVDLIVIHEVDLLPDGITRQVETVVRLASVSLAALPHLGAAKRLLDFGAEVGRLERAAGRTHRRAVAGILADADAGTAAMLRHTAIADELKATIDAFQRVAHTAVSIAVKEF